MGGSGISVVGSLLLLLLQKSDLVVVLQKSCVKQNCINEGFCSVSSSENKKNFLLERLTKIYPTTYTLKEPPLYNA